MTHGRRSYETKESLVKLFKMFADQQKATHRIVGGSNATLVNWLNGAKLSFPSTDVVLIQPIGLGMTMLLKGS